MPSVFTDEAGSYDLAINTAADWTVSSGGMPNGDNYVSPDGTVAATVNTSGTSFNIADGTAWTIEFWIYIASATAVTQAIIGNWSNGSAATYHFAIYLAADESIVFNISNTGGTAYLGASSSASSITTGAWHLVHCVKETGNVIKVYINETLNGSDSTTSGTVRTPAAGYWLYLGTFGDGTADAGASSSGMRLAKLAIYNSELTADQKHDHYLAMTAA